MGRSPVHRRLLLMISAVGASVILLTAPAAAAPHSVSVTSYMFSPGTLTIHVGDTVTWTNNDSPVGGNTHTVTSKDGHSFDSGYLSPGQSFTFTFTKAGTFAYHCTIHPTLMNGTVTVVGTTASPTPTPTHSRPKASATATAKPQVVPVSPTPTSSVKPSPRASKTLKSSKSPTVHSSPSVTPSASRVVAAGSSSNGNGAEFGLAAGIFVVVVAGATFLLRRRRTVR